MMIFCEVYYEFVQTQKGKYMFTREQVEGVVRHVLTFAGGWFIAQGWVDETMMMEAIGGVVSIVGVAWSYMSKAAA